MASTQRISASHRRRRTGQGKGGQGQVAQAVGSCCRATAFTVGLVFAVAGPLSTVRGQSPHQVVAATVSSGLGLLDQSQQEEIKIIPPAPTQQTVEPAQPADKRLQSRDDIGPLTGEIEKLTLADVIASLYRAYPEIAAARQQNPLAAGQQIEAMGAFDTKLEAYTLNEPTGFYENSRHGIGVARQTWWGGYLSAGYRIGRGAFQPWYKERETNEGGEFSVTSAFPLLQGRALDSARVAVFQASVARQMSGPMVQQAILEASREATLVYWQWVATGAISQAQRELLELAEQRGKQYQAGVQAGKFAEIDLILNQQLIAERRANALETEQKFRALAFRLSLFLRDQVGRPMLPRNEWLPNQFPVIEAPPPGDFQQDLADALARRPEPQLLQLEIRQLQLERQLAQNMLLPTLDVVAEASQDVGAQATSARDKGQFELVVGLQGEVPIQRRKARGKIQSVSAKTTQMLHKLELQRNTFGAELQTAYNSLVLATQIVQQAEISLRAAFETLQRYRFAFERGKIDLIYLNFLESKVTETEIKLVGAQQGWFEALARMQYALGLDPLDQAMIIAELPFSTRPGPGNLPATSTPNAQQLDADWKVHNTPQQ